MQSDTTRVPLFDASRQYASVKEEVDEAISSVLERGNYVLGENVGWFEKEFAAYLGVKHAVGVGSGTDALELALRATGFQQGNLCVAPANTFFSVVPVVESCGGKLGLTDIEPGTYNMDPSGLVKSMREGTRVVVPTHIYGQAADMDSILEARTASSLVVVEDVAQALGATYDGSRVGSIGDISCFSFHPSKNLGAYGDAGAVATNDGEFAEHVRAFRNFGESQKYVHNSIGRNSRLDEIQAAILRVKLKHLDQWNRQRRKLATLYDEYLDRLDSIITPAIADGRDHVYSLYVVRSKQRDDLMTWLARCGVSTGIHYPRPLHFQPACGFLGYKSGDFPNAESCAKEILSLPMFPEMHESEVAYVCEKIAEFYAVVGRRKSSRVD